MATEREPKLSWEVKVPVLLQSGTLLTKWEEESNACQDCKFKLDKYGFFLSWQDEKEANCLDLCHVSEVRLGGTPKDTKLFDLLQNCGPEPLEHRSFTLTYGTNLVDVSYLHLSASSINLAMEWVAGLQPLLHNLPFLNCSMMTRIFKQYVKVRLMIDPQCNKISVSSICKCLQAGKYEDRVLDGLQALDLSFSKDEKINPKKFSFENFYQLYQRVCPRLELEQLCIKWGGGRAPYFGVSKFVNFLNSEQRDPRLNEIIYPYYNKERALSLIWNYERSLDMLQRDRISVDGLTRYLMSNDNLLLMPNKFEIYQDMSQPLSHYFINSSHNTYLVGRQWGGKSSVEMYRQCLLAGCRCIELDCWDGPGDEPLITHGKAMCTNVAFKDVIEAIRDTAFIVSDYPVILSFENHCSKQQQLKMAVYCTEIFGDMLLSKPLDNYPLEEGNKLPSPNALKRKILIKNKKLKPEQEADSDSFLDISEICSDFEPTEVSDQTKTMETVKETPIIDDEDDVKIDEEFIPVKRDVEKMSLTEEELKKIVKFGRRLSCSLIKEATSLAADSASITSQEVKYFSLSEYSTYLISRIMNDSLNGFCRESVSSFPSEETNGLSNIEGDSISDDNTETFSVASSEDTLSVKSRSSSDLSKYSDLNRASTASTLSTSSCHSDPFVDNAMETPPVSTPALTVTQFHYSTQTESKEAEGSAELSQPAEQRRNRDYKPSTGTLEAIKETREPVENGELEEIHVSDIDTFRDTPSRTVVNGYGTEQRNSAANGSSKIDNFRSRSNAYSPGSFSERKDSITSDHTPSSRKESNASTQSMESNSDESEERDVLGEGFKGKREPSEKSKFGSSVRQHVIMKKSSRAVSLTPDDISEIMQVYNHQHTTGSINPRLSALVNYVHPVGFSGFEEAERKNFAHHMSSFNESTGFGLVKANPTEFIKYNRRQMSRIYPKGSRVDSSNYNPQMFWNVGCQMVSLNFQTSDLAMQLNNGKFEYNGGVGYLLKPDLLRRADRHFDPFTESMIENTIAAYVAVEVISGQFLSDKRISTCVEVDMYGLPTDTIRKRYRTKLVQNNGMNPVYEEDEFVFRRVVFPELVLLRFTVLDDNDRLIAQRVLPLEGLQAGYRHIPLRTESSSPLPLSSLFCKFTLKTYVPETYRAYVDELSEPIKFQSAADKRAAQMQVFGIDELDLPDMGFPTLPPPKKDSITNKANALSKIKASSMTSISSIAGCRNSRESISSLSNGLKYSYGSELSLVQENNLPKKQETKFYPIYLEDLKKDRAYIREYKKHQREMESLNKKYNKERLSMRKWHTKQLEKLVTSYEKLKENARKTYEGAVRKTSKEGEKELRKTHEAKIAYLSRTQREKANEILTAQTTEWTNMINSQVQEEIGFYETQAEELLEVLKKILDNGHDAQTKEITNKHEKESQELTGKQTKQSMDASRLLLKDKAIKSKEERERRLRQRDKKNLVQFTDERRQLKERQEREVEDLKSTHSEDKEKLVIDYRKVVSEQIESIKAKGEKHRKAVRSAYQTLLPSHKP